MLPDGLPSRLFSGPVLGRAELHKGDAVEDNIESIGPNFDSRIPGGGMGIKRAKRDRWVLGVCGGLAHHFGWSSKAVRLVTAILAIPLPGPSLEPTILVYVLLGYLLPETEAY